MASVGLREQQRWLHRTSSVAESHRLQCSEPFSSFKQAPIRKRSVDSAFLNGAGPGTEAWPSSQFLLSISDKTEVITLEHLRRTGSTNEDGVNPASSAPHISRRKSPSLQEVFSAQVSSFFQKGFFGADCKLVILGFKQHWFGFQPSSFLSEKKLQFISVDVGQRTSEHATSWSGGSALAPLRVATPLDGSVSKISTDPTIKRKKTFPDQIRDLTDLSALISPAVGFLTPNEKKTKTSCSHGNHSLSGSILSSSPLHLGRCERLSEL